MELQITIYGKGGHGSRPDLGINPVDCFAAIYGALQAIGCTVTKVDGGTARNIIPEQLRFTCQCTDPEAVQRIVNHTCTAFLTRAEY